MWKVLCLGTPDWAHRGKELKAISLLAANRMGSAEALQIPRGFVIRPFGEVISAGLLPTESFSSGEKPHRTNKEHVSKFPHSAAK